MLVLPEARLLSSVLEGNPIAVGDERRSKTKGELRVKRLKWRHKRSDSAAFGVLEIERQMGRYNRARMLFMKTYAIRCGSRSWTVCTSSATAYHHVQLSRK